MKTDDYIVIIEKKFGKVKLPSNQNEVLQVKKNLLELLEYPTLTDWNILIAIKIIEDWNDCNIKKGIRS